MIEMKKVPYTLILGDNEKQENTVSYRLHGEKDTTTVSQEEFISMIKKEVDNKELRK